MREYKFDPGRVLTPEEREEVSKTITPIHLIRTKTCKREGTNCGYRGRA